MPDTKISALAAKATPASADVVVLLDVSDTTMGPAGSEKQATLGQVIASRVAGTYAPLDSPALAGTPTAPTATVGTNTTQVATTAFVLANAGAGAVSSVAGRTGDVVLAEADIAGLVAGLGGKLAVAGNLADVSSAAAARTNLGLAAPTFAVSRYGPHSDGTNDDWPAFAACVNACVAAGGGEVLVDVPLWFLGSQTGSWSAGASNLVFRGRGDASRITLGTPGGIVFNIANMNLLAFLDLVFVGAATGDSCVAIFDLNNWQTVWQRCSFLGVRSGDGLAILVGGHNIFRDCKFGGCGSSAGPGLIRCFAGAKLLLDGTHFIDFGSSRGVSYSGRTNPAYPWVFFRGNGSPAGAQEGAEPIGLHIKDCFFDEGCFNAVNVGLDDVSGPWNRLVLIEDCAFNDPGAGPAIDLSGVRVAKIGDSSLNWNSPGVAIKARNAGYLAIERCSSTLTSAPTIDADATVGMVDLRENTGLARAVGFAPGVVTEQSAGVVAFGVSPTAPTPTVGDNSTRVATTAHVRAGYAAKAATAVTGSRGGNAALASLLTALAAAGLITDSTTT